MKVERSLSANKSGLKHILNVCPSIFSALWDGIRFHLSTYNYTYLLTFGFFIVLYFDLNASIFWMWVVIQYTKTDSSSLTACNLPVCRVCYVKVLDYYWKLVIFFSSVQTKGYYIEEFFHK